MKAPTHLEIDQLRHTAAQLLLFQDVLTDPIGQAWQTLVDHLATQGSSSSTIMRAYGSFFSALANEQLSWPDYLIQQIRWSDNALARAAARQALDTLPQPLIEAGRHDLRCLQQLANSELILRYPLQQLGIQVWWTDPRPPQAGWDPYQQQVRDWADTLEYLAHHYRSQGVGLCARYRAFRWVQDQLQGVAHPDPVTFEQLYGNQRQQQQLWSNTEALLARKPAHHVLLYGARGTGKSSMTKALLNRYDDQGLRLLELSRADLVHMPRILDELHQHPQAFILFVDDLSFEADETDFKQLKVLLDGDITAQPRNVKLYATTNRRHLIRDYFQDRPAPDNEEVHAWDTVQEKLSLRDRFGLTLTFLPFRQSDYLATIDHLLTQINHSWDPDHIRRQAIMWAQQQNGFSGRTARQFVDSLQSGLIPAS